MSLQLEYRFARTERQGFPIVDMSKPERDPDNQQILWMGDVWKSIQMLSNPMKLEDIIEATNRSIGERRSDMEIIIAVGGLLATKHLILADS